MSPADRPLGLGLIGCGRVSKLHLDAGAALRGARLVAVADVVAERAAAAAEPYGAAACGSAEELAARDDVDIAVVATPSGTHAELGMVAARHGKHVVVEKPIDVDPAAARRLIATCHQQGVALSVISQHRFDPGSVRLKAAVDAGGLDPVVLAEGRVWWYRGDSYYRADAWRGTRAQDGGALMNQGIHTVDLLRWLLGPVESVHALAATAVHGIEMEDTLAATLRFARGTLATLAVTTAAAPGQAEVVTLAGPAGTFRLESGALHAQPAGGGLTVDGVGPDAEDASKPTAARGSTDLAATAHQAQLQDVVDAVLAGRPPAVTGEDGLAALEVVDAAYRSASTGQPVVPGSSPPAPAGTAT